MALRRFRSAEGREWQVWETYPSRNLNRTALDRYMANQPVKDGVQPVAVRPQYSRGWLTFLAGGERRRLVPIPAGWETADDAHLRLYLGNAKPATTG